VHKRKLGKMVKDLINREGYKTFKVETKRGNKRFSHGFTGDKQAAGRIYFKKCA